MKPRILYLVLSDLDSLTEKGVAEHISHREEFGYFERVVTIHPISPAKRTVELSTNHIIYELGLQYNVLFPFLFLSGLVSICSIACMEEIRIIRATDPYLMGFMALIVSKILGLPYCISVHTDYSAVYDIKARSRFHRLRLLCASKLPYLVLPSAAAVMPIRVNYIPSLCSAGASASKIRVVPHGLDLSLFNRPSDIDIHSALSMERSKRLISIACRMHAFNYIEDIVRIISDLLRTRSDVSFVICGRGPQEEFVHKEVSRLPNSCAVNILPFQPPDYVIALRRVSSVSLCLRGGFSLIEAALCGSPIVSYDVDWHSELIQDNKTGFLRKEHDIGGVVESINWILDHPNESRLIAKRAMATAIARHDLRKTSRIKCLAFEEMLMDKSHDRSIELR